MLRFKQFLIEGIVRSVGRKIFVEPPSPHATEEFTNPIYNQIVTRPEPIKFDAFDKNLQSFWRSPREKLISSSDGAWDFMDVGSKNIDDIRAASPSYQRGKTFKGYFSLADVHDPEVVKKFGEAVPDLHRRLTGVADNFETSFSFKVPKYTKSVGEHVDSIVFHHYDIPDSSLHRSINATTKKWAADHGLELLDRHGLDTGVDIKGEGSFSEQLAKRIAKGEKGSLSHIGKQILDSATAPQKIWTRPLPGSNIPGVGAAANIGAGILGVLAGEHIVKPAAEKAGVFNAVERGTQAAMSRMSPGMQSAVSTGLDVADTVANTLVDPIGSYNEFLANQAHNSPPPTEEERKKASRRFEKQNY